MQRIEWTASGGPIPDCFALVPDTEEERQELAQALADNGVHDSLAFNKAGINGVLEVPEKPEWDSNGAVKASVKVQGENRPRDGWFWIIECDDGSGRRFAWWSLRPNQETANAWT